MAHLFLIGGGHDPDGRHQTNVPFAEAVLATGCNDVALVVLDEGVNTKVEERVAALGLVGLEPEVFLVAPGRPPVGIGQPRAVYVTGGLTPSYQAALCPDASWLPADAIYGGFSAGAAIAPELALVGGWRMGGAQSAPRKTARGWSMWRSAAGSPSLSQSSMFTALNGATLAGSLRSSAGVTGGPGGVSTSTRRSNSATGVPVTVHGEGAAWLVERLNDGLVAVRPQRRGPLQT